MGAVKSYPWFPSFRSLTAMLLCLCFASVHMMNSNMGMAIVCMVNSTEFSSSIHIEGGLPLPTTTNGSFLENEDTLLSSKSAAKLNWSAEDQGLIFGAFNAGLICMLITGFLADKFNAKYMLIAAVFLAAIANFMIPLLAPISVYFAILARFMVGLADALLQPAVNSLLTRWFPAAERSYALGVASGGRQIGTLLIVPTAGALCSQTVLFGGWPSIFFVSATVGLIFIFIYILIGADKPSKQSFISEQELKFITMSNTSEDVGKKRTERKVPWMKIMKSKAVWAALISVVCHEIPLMTMIMFLPSYLHDVHHYEATKNGLLSALPTACHWASKIGCSYLNTWLIHHTTWNKTSISKVLNGVGSAGIAIFQIGVTFLDSSRAFLAVVFLCLSMVCTGMHTPGCQGALVAIAPAYSGAITGLTFFFVAISGIANPLLTKWIVQTGSIIEWNLVFYISSVIAFLPVIIFSIWGSAEVQKWAKSPKAYAEHVATTQAKMPKIKNGNIKVDISTMETDQAR
uniref:Major facilitator superfamily (MFS) profile domain-containing protein n=1 Tax=Acrobeloides nanus TaxID=290746 RepID=A0A914E8N1_9BILA